MLTLLNESFGEMFDQFDNMFNEFGKLFAADEDNETEEPCCEKEEEKACCCKKEEKNEDEPKSVFYTKDETYVDGECVESHEKKVVDGKVVLDKNFKQEPSIEDKTKDGDAETTEDCTGKCCCKKAEYECDDADEEDKNLTIKLLRETIEKQKKEIKELRIHNDKLSYANQELVKTNKNLNELHRDTWKAMEKATSEMKAFYGEK